MHLPFYVSLYALLLARVQIADEVALHKKRMKKYVDQLDKINQDLYLAIDYAKSPDIVDLVRNRFSVLQHPVDCAVPCTCSYDLPSVHGSIYSCERPGPGHIC